MEKYMHKQYFHNIIRNICLNLNVKLYLECPNKDTWVVMMYENIL